MYKSKISTLVICFLAFYTHSYGMDSLTVEKKDGDKPPYIACESFSTERVTFKRVSSAQQEIECYKAIYAESKNRNFWFSGVEPLCMFDKSKLDDEAIASIKRDYGTDAIFTTDHDIIQKKDIGYFQRKEQLGFYKSSMSFADYILLDKGSNELVGRFIFKDTVQDDRIEYGIYIFEKFRKNGLGVEIISGIFKSVIEPAIGQHFVISCYVDRDDVQLKQSPFETTVHHNFQGVFGKAAPWYNYPSVSVSNKSGCVLRWKDHEPITFYPQGSQSCMDQTDVACFSQVVKTLFTLSEISKMNQETKEGVPTIQPKAFFSAFVYTDEDSNEEDPFKDEIMEGLYGLLNTKDYDTFISTIEALIYMGESRDDLRDELVPEDVSDLLSKNKSYLSGKHKELLEYLSKEPTEESSSESSEEANSESSEGEIIQKSKKKHLSDSDEEDAFRPNKRKKQTK